ncbi:MAG: hypothetical protein MI861_09980 [Pirellulales bacterium]|nr:hypothetical protein [Pirellulales bacterium]
MLKKIGRVLPLVRQTIKIYETLVRIEKELAQIRTIESIRAFENEWSRNERFQDPKRLLSHSAQVNSQNGEDGMIAEVFRRIGTESKTFVEIGLEDGRECNSAFLLSCGWNGFWVDGGTRMRRTAQRHPDIDSRCLTTLTAFVTAENAGDLFAEMKVPRQFDLLSLDIDQNTYYVWKALADYRPRAAIIEYNSAILPSIDWKVNYSPDRVWDQSQNYGASLKALELLGEELGYKLVGCDFTGTNAFFVREDLVSDRFAAPFTSENHYEPPRYPFLRHCRAQRTLLDRPQAA